MGKKWIFNMQNKNPIVLQKNKEHTDKNNSKKDCWEDNNKPNCFRKKTNFICKIKEKKLNSKIIKSNFCKRNKSNLMKLPLIIYYLYKISLQKMLISRIL